MESKNQVINIDVQTTDKTGPGLESARKQLSSFDKSISKTQQKLKAMMAAEYRTVINAIDRVTPTAGRVRSSLRALTGASYLVSIKAVDKTAAVITNLKGKIQALKSTAGNIFSAATGLTGQMAAGAGIGYGIYDTVNTYKNFEAQMSSVGSILGENSGSQTMQELSQKAKEMGAITQFSATEAGQALQYMAMAGWKTGDMMDGIKPIMDLAAASGEDLAHTSDIVTDALTAFGLKARDAGHFADVLAQASSNSNTNVAMMGLSFQYAAPLAGALKYSVEDVSLALGLMANAGIKADKAGTALRSTFSRLIDPPKSAAESLELLGIDAKNDDGSMKPWRKTLMELRGAFRNLTEAEKAQHASNIAGQEAMSGFLAMINATDDELGKLAHAVDTAAGATERMAKIKMNNLAGDLKILASTWESVQLSLMEGSGSNFLREFVQGVQKDLEKFNGYLKDGFDITDIGKVAIDVIIQLKNKFLELDGVGSILAGGALAAGLHKIIGLTRSAAGAFGSAGGAISSAGGFTSAANMTVNAGTVIVNGSAAGGGVTGALGDAAGGAAGKAGAAGAASRFGSLAAKLATPLMAAVSALNIYEATENSARRAEEAEWRIQEAARSGDDTEYANALDYQERVRQLNNEETYSSIVGGGFGTALTAIGTAFGGPIGAAIGGAIGQALGEKGREAAQVEAAIRDDNKREELIAQIRADEELMLEETEININDMQTAWGDASSAAARESQQASATVENAFSGMGDSISSALSGIGGWLSSLGSRYFDNPTPHAAGGFAFSPHLGLVGEAGPEAIIPLGTGMRERGLDLLGKAAEMLGVDVGENGLAAFAGTGSSDPVKIELGGISPTFNITGNGDPEKISEVISQKMGAIADNFAAIMAEKLSQINSNQPITA